MVSLKKTVMNVPVLRDIAAQMFITDLTPSEEAARDQHIKSLFDKGYSILPDFLTPDECAVSVDWMRGIEKKNPDAGYPYDRRFWLTSDIPMLEPMRRFMESRELHAVAEGYMGTRVTCDVMLANIVRKGGENLGSGNGWHRDGTRRGIKAILYLVDVTPENGALTVVTESFKKRDIIKDSRRYDLNPFDVTLRDAKYNDRIDRILRDQPERRHPFTGKAGTVFLFETRALHRGMPILKEGAERFALTNYYEEASRATVEKKRAAQGVLLKV